MYIYIACRIKISIIQEYVTLTFCSFHQNTFALRHVRGWMQKHLVLEMEETPFMFIFKYSWQIPFEHKEVFHVLCALSLGFPLDPKYMWRIYSNHVALEANRIMCTSSWCVSASMVILNVAYISVIVWRIAMWMSWRNGNKLRDFFLSLSCGYLWLESTHAMQWPVTKLIFSMRFRAM